MRKPRSDSKLKNLPEETQERIADWCKGDGLEAALQRCKIELGFTSSVSALSGWYRWWEARLQLHTAADLADDVKQLLKDCPDLSESQLANATQFVFERQALESRDSKLHVALAKVRQGSATLALKEKQLAQKDKEIEIKLRRLELLEAKEAQAKTVLGDGSLSMSEREARMKQLFGM